MDIIVCPSVVIDGDHDSNSQSTTVLRSTFSSPTEIANNHSDLWATKDCTINPIFPLLVVLEDAVNTKDVKRYPEAIRIMELIHEQSGNLLCFRTYLKLQLCLKMMVSCCCCCSCCWHCCCSCSSSSTCRRHDHRHHQIAKEVIIIIIIIILINNAFAFEWLTLDWESVIHLARISR